tara:strand:+ start:395 stop:805 length:411 start_codon:yes stop_codon:yes gene_type:complete
MANKSFNLLHFTKDVRVSNHLAWFGSISFATFGGGLMYQKNYNDNGITASAAITCNTRLSIIPNISVAYQFKLFKGNTFLSLGLGGMLWEQINLEKYHKDCLGIEDECYDNEVWKNKNYMHYEPSMYPVISLDIRY